jgi:cell division FtsZ-interacting protein ZapD
MNCHSFFTGVYNVSKAGEAEKFFKRQEKAEQIASSVKKRSKLEKKAEKDQRRKEKLAQSVGIDMDQISTLMDSSGKQSMKEGESKNDSNESQS